MWAQGAVPPTATPLSHPAPENETQLRQNATLPQATRLDPQETFNQELENSPQLENSTSTPLQDLSHENLVKLVMQLQHQAAENRIYKEKYLQTIRATEKSAPIQETLQNVPEGDESLTARRQQGGGDEVAEDVQASSVPLRATMVRPDTRMFLTDSLGVRAENGRMFGYGQEPVNNDAHSPPVMAWSESHVIDTQSVEFSEERKILLLTIKDYQSQVREKDSSLKETRDLNSTLQTQLQAKHMEATRLKKDLEMCKAEKSDEVKKREEIIKRLKEKLQQWKNKGGPPNQTVPLRPGIKRGRFFMSRAPTLECINCSAVFSSHDVARNSVCAHHPKMATGLPNKMVAELRELFPEGSLKQRYWPCCHAISNSTPPPCYHGNHVLV